MAFPFDKKLGELKGFYDYTLKLYNWGASVPMPSAVDISVVQSVAVQMAGYQVVTAENLRQAVVALMCSLWEALVVELRATDTTRHAAKIVPPHHKWFDVTVHEIALVRHCILHNGGIVNQKYLQDSTNPYSYKLGDSIKLDDKIDKFFIDMAASFSNLMR